MDAADWDRIMRELKCHYVIAGLEQCPTTGRWHYHIYLEFDRPWSFARLRNYLPFAVNDIQPRFGSVKEAIDYCKKDGHWWEKGEHSEQGHRTDLNSLYDEIRGGASLSEIVEHHVGAYVRYHKGIEKLMDIVRREQDREAERVDVETIVYVGKSGTGKSHRCFNDPDYRESGYKFPTQAPGKVFFDGYDGQRTMWFDEFGGTTEWRPREAASLFLDLGRSSYLPPHILISGGPVVLNIWRTLNSSGDGSHEYTISQESLDTTASPFLLNGQKDLTTQSPTRLTSRQPHNWKENKPSDEDQ